MCRSRRGGGRIHHALLSRGAGHVYAIDVGFGQLRGSLRLDPRVTNLERTNLADAARHIPATERVVVLTVDLPFISLSKALPQIRDVPFAPGASLIALVKPQFELGLDRPPVALDDLDRAFDTACAGGAAAGWRPLAGMRSPIRGARGSREFFLLAMWRGRRGAE